MHIYLQDILLCPDESVFIKIQLVLNPGPFLHILLTGAGQEILVNHGYSQM
jgi:hypothetical protein